MKIGKKVLLQILIVCLATFALSVTKVQAQDTADEQRIAGCDRYQTSIEISKFGWNDASQTAIIATGENFPDALSAAPLAAKFKAPILLTDPFKMDASLYKELSRLKVKNVYIAGGYGAVSKDIEDQLTQNGIKCTRLPGNDRFETSVAIAKQLGSVNKAVLATGSDFPDALSIAPWAAQNGIPILLTDKDTLPQSVDKYIKDNNITETYVIGGKGVISDECMAMLPKPKRIHGTDRFETNLSVLKEFDSSFDFSRIYAATGNDFPDALSGSALASITKSPIVLMDEKPLTKTKTFLETKKDKINDAYIMGGTGAVSDAVIEGTIPPVVTKLKISTDSSTLALNGKVKPAVDITMFPQNAPVPDISISSSDINIAQVDKDGTVTGLYPGSVKLTAKAGNRSTSTDLKVILNKTIMLDPGHGGTDPGAIPTALDGTKLQQSKESTLNFQIAQKLKDKLLGIGVNVLMTRNNDATVSISDRAKMANDKKPDLFISIHHDAVSYPTAHGTSAFYSSYRTNLDNQDVYAVSMGNGPVYDDKGNIIGTMMPNEKYKFVKEVDTDNIYIIYKGKTAKTSLDYIILYDYTPNEVCKDSKELAEAINEGLSSLGLIKRPVQDKNLAITRWTNMASVLFEVGFITTPDEFARISQDSFQEKVADVVTNAILDFYKNKADACDASTKTTTP